MNATDYKFYKSLKIKPISIKKTPKAVKSSSFFKNLFGAGILDTEKSGRGTNVIIRKPEEYDILLGKNFPSNENLTPTKANNIKQFKNSKARRTNEVPMFFIRGFKSLSINGAFIDLKHFTQSFGFFGLTNLDIETDKICFVENKNTFLNAEKILGKDWIFVHSYGRIGKKTLAPIACNSVLVFGDYDFNGLDEFLRIKSHFEGAVLYVPVEFEILFETYGRKLKGKQRASKKVSECLMSDIIMIRTLVETTNRFLEQEILINDQ